MCFFYLPQQFVDQQYASQPLTVIMRMPIVDLRAAFALLQMDYSGCIASFVSLIHTFALVVMRSPFLL